MNPLAPLLDSPLIEFFVQSGGTASNAQKAGALFGSLLAVAVVLFGILVGHLIMSFFFKRICEKCGHEPGVLIWIPIANLVPLLHVTKLPMWMIVPLIIPLIQVVAFIVLFWKLCEARGKAGPLALLLLIPGIGTLVLLVLLAFTD